MNEQPKPVVGLDEVEWHDHLEGDCWGGSYKPLTPLMDASEGVRIGVNLTRVPPGRTCVPFHAHALEDEIFYVVSGRGWLRYGDDLHPLKPGDTISCPAGTGIGHQIANPFDEDLLYLAIGTNHPHETCVYPDTGKVLVRSFGTGVGRFTKTEYMDGEPDAPRIFELLPDS